MSQPSPRHWDDDEAKKERPGLGVGKGERYVFSAHTLANGVHFVSLSFGFLAQGITGFDQVTPRDLVSDVLRF